MEQCEIRMYAMRQTTIVDKASTAGDRLIRRSQGSVHADCGSHV